MSDEKTIVLKFNREDFEQIYNLKKYRNIITNPHTRISFWLVIILSISFFISLYRSVSENDFVVLTIILCIFLILSIILLCFASYPYIKWARAVSSFIDSNSKYVKQELIITGNTMELVLNETHTIEKWSSIVNVKIEPTYILINGSAQYIFPRKSMAEAEFEYLKDIVIEKGRWDSIKKEAVNK